MTNSLDRRPLKLSPRVPEPYKLEVEDLLNYLSYVGLKFLWFPTRSFSRSLLATRLAASRFTDFSGKFQRERSFVDFIFISLLFYVKWKGGLFYQVKKLKELISFCLKSIFFLWMQYASSNRKMGKPFSFVVFWFVRLWRWERTDGPLTEKSIPKKWWLFWWWFFF